MEKKHVVYSESTFYIGEGFYTIRQIEEMLKVFSGQATERAEALSQSMRKVTGY